MMRAILNRLAPGSPLLILAAATFVGCGGNDNVDVYPVKGVVTFDGQPMKGGGSISLVPVDKQKGKAAGGVIDAGGNYTLSTYGDGDGSMPGEFRVIITQTVYDEPDFGGDSDSGGGATEPVVRVVEANRIPPIYSHPIQSPIKIKVEAKENVIDIKLDRQTRIVGA